MIKARQSQFRALGHCLSESAVPLTMISAGLSEVQQWLAGIESERIIASTLHDEGRFAGWKMLNARNNMPSLMEIAKWVLSSSDLTEIYGGRCFRIWRDQLVVKPPGAGKTMWHQDSFYWPEIAGRQHITAWIALDEVCAANGALVIVERSHLNGLQTDLIGQLKTIPETVVRVGNLLIKAETIAMSPGEVHFHDGMAWHGAHANNTTRWRYGYAVHFSSTDLTQNDYL